MSIVIGCDSFLALRNVRNGDLARHLEGEHVVAFVHPSQYEGSVAVAPDVAVSDMVVFICLAKALIRQSGGEQPLGEKTNGAAVTGSTSITSA